jgi:hypothetical protein
MASPDLARRLAPLGLEVTVEAGRGRCLRATRDFARGEVALASAPFASLLLPHLAPTRCSGCFARAEASELARCGACRRAQYCSRACQKRDWRAGHRHECAARADLDLAPVAVAVEAALISRVAREEASQKIDAPDPPSHRLSRDVALPRHGLPSDDASGPIATTLRPTAADVAEMRLWANREGEGPEASDAFADPSRRPCPRGENQNQNQNQNRARPSSHSVVPEPPSPAAALATRLGLFPPEPPSTRSAERSDERSDGSGPEREMGRVGVPGVSVESPPSTASAYAAASRRNDFAVMDALLTPVAAACYPLGALLNHSCDPTCVAAYDYVRGSDSPGGPEKDGVPAWGFWRQSFRCARAVRRGEELTHAYVDASDLPLERRDALLKTYGFACDCARCPPMGPEGPFSMGERGSAEEDASIEAAAELLRRAAEAEAVDEERALAESALAALGGAEGDVRDDDVGVTFDDVQTRDDANDDDDESDARTSTVFSGRRGKKGGSPSALAAWRVKALDLAAHAAMLAGDWPAASRRFEALVPRRIAACGSRFHPRVALDLVTLRAVLAQAEEGVGGAVEEEKKKKKKEKVEEATRDALDVLRVVAGEASELFVDTKREAAAGR